MSAVKAWTEKIVINENDFTKSPSQAIALEATSLILDIVKALQSLPSNDLVQQQCDDKIASALVWASRGHGLSPNAESKRWLINVYTLMGEVCVNEDNRQRGRDCAIKVVKELMELEEKVKMLEEVKILEEANVLDQVAVDASNQEEVDASN